MESETDSRLFQVQHKDRYLIILLLSNFHEIFSLLVFEIIGGETASTGIKKLWLHAEHLSARKKDGT